jgi:hypothetical protein
MEVSTQNLQAESYAGEMDLPAVTAFDNVAPVQTVIAGRIKVPNSLEIGSRALGDVDSPIMAADHELKPGDIILSRARTLSMHTIIALGQIYKYSWDTDNSFRFWSHPAMIVAVTGQTIRNVDGTKEATVIEDVLVQATVNPNGVNFALLKDFRKAYSSRCWVFSPGKFDLSGREKAVQHAVSEEGKSLFEWLEENKLLVDITDVPLDKRKPSERREARHVTYGMLSLASVLVSQVFAKWRFRFFNEGQVNCSSFIAELMEKANYMFPSDIHAFPGEVAEQLYADFQNHQEMQKAESSNEKKGASKGWIQGVAQLRKQISNDRKVMLKNAGTFRMSSRALKALLIMVAIAGFFAWAISAWIWPHIQGWPWVVRVALAGFSVYAIAVAAPIAYYAGRAFLNIAFKGIPQLIAMLRPLYWRRLDDLK